MVCKYRTVCMNHIIIFCPLVLTFCSPPVFVDRHWLQCCWNPQPFHLHNAQRQKSTFPSVWSPGEWLAAARAHSDTEMWHHNNRIQRACCLWHLKGRRAPLNFTFCLDPIFLNGTFEFGPFLMSAGILRWPMRSTLIIWDTASNPHSLIFYTCTILFRVWGSAGAYPKSHRGTGLFACL